MSDRITDEVTRMLLKGDTLIRLGKEEEAFDVFEKLTADHPDDPKVFFETGERCRRLAERRFYPNEYASYFEKAVELFERSQKIFDATMSPPPCHPTYLRAFLYDNLGYYEKAIEMQEEIITRLKRDYSETDIRWPLEMIEAMKNKIAQRGQ